jgi:tetratricopeptide (TPR) repeat protein
VARQLQVKLLGNEAAKIEVGGTSNPEAYIAYLHGTHLEAVAESEADYRAALAAFDQAIALDPNYAAAYAYRAGLLVDILSSSTDSHSRESLRDQARRAAERSIALAPALADAHRALWLVRAIGYLDFAGAAPEIERARTLAPGNARVLEAFAGFEVLLGHAEAAVAAAQRAVALDALNYDSRVRLVLVLYYARRFSDALGAAQEARALRPKGSQGRDVEELTAASYLAPGQADEARQLCESPAMPLNDVLRRMLLSIAYRALGKAEQADNELAKFMAVAGDSGAFNYARIYAQQGNTALALQWLATAEHLHDPFLQLLRVDWMLDPIRNTPQFKALEARMNFPP